MDCSTALEILESALPSGRDLQAPEFTDAALHVEACAVCAATFEDRQLVDRRIGEALWNVPVPPAMKEQLLTSVSASSQNADDSAIAEGASRAVEPSPRMTRRSWLTIVASSAVALLLGIVGWQAFFRPSMPAIVLEQLLTDERLLAAVADPQMRDEFNQAFPAQLPFEWNHRRLSVTERPQGFVIDGETQQMLALYDFRLTWRNRSVDGVLAVMPAEWVRDLPTAQSFAAGSTAGTPPGVGPFTPAMWTDGDRVYICFVGEASGLQVLSDALSGNAA